MRTNLRRRIASALPVALVTACLFAWPTSAAAVDLTGTWSGKAVCKGLWAGNKTNDTYSDLAAQITQSGAELNMLFFGFRYAGAIQDDNTYPTKKAQGTFILCSTVNDYSALSEMGSFSVTLNLVDDTKTLFKATSVFSTGLDNFQTCKYTFRRINPANPNVTGC